MKRVLSIMLTLMLVFTMISGITASAAVEWSDVLNANFTTWADNSAKVSYPMRYGASTQNRAEFRYNVNTPTNSGSYPELVYTVSTVSKTVMESTHPAATTGATGSGNYAKVERESNVGCMYLRMSTATGIEVGDKVRITFKVYPTDICTSATASDGTIQPVLDTAGTVSELTYAFSDHYYSSASSTKSGDFNESVTLKANQWNTVVKEYVTTKANINGFYLKYGNAEYSEESYTTPFAKTMFIDGDVKIERGIVSAEPSAALDSRFKSNMVFQRNQPIEICGTSTEAGKTVTVTLGGNSATTTTNDTGKWSVTLPAMAAQTGLTLNMTCNDEAETNVNVTGIAIGEIILAAGQSNMNRSVSTLYNATVTKKVDGVDVTYDVTELADEKAAVQAAVADLQNVDVRMLNFNDTNAANDYTWARVTRYEKTSDGDSIYHRSLIGFMTAYKLAKAEGITVAFADAAIGGASIEAFFSPETLAKYPSLTPADPSVTTIENLKTVPQGLYNAWLSHIKGMKFGSVVWYQGEENADNNVAQDAYYNMLTDLINQFRRDYKNANLPIAVVQLAPYSDTRFITVRQAQLDVANDMNNVYLISTADAGPTEIETDVIHPLNKMPVINRAFNIIKYALKGENVEYSSPLYNKMVVKGNEATLTFNHAFDYETVARFTSMVASKNVSGSGYTKRFGEGSSAARMEFRDDANTGNFTSLSKATTTSLTATYPDIANGATGSSLAIAVRTANVGYVRFAELVQGDVFKKGDRVRVTVRAYPTDMVGNADTITWTIKGLRHTASNANGTQGEGNERNIYLKPNQWNIITYESVCYEDMVSGAQIQFNPEGETSFPGKIFFDDYMVVERVAADDVETKSLKTSDGGTVKGFQIAGADGVFYDADATINGDAIIVSSENVASPVEVRYCYVSWDENDHSTLGGNVVNAAGLPLVPFKANAAAVEIDSVTGSGYNYTVKLSNDVYNTAPGYVVAALYDGDVLVQVKTVYFSITERKSATQTVTFDPETAPSKPNVKIMAWKDISTTLVPYCAAK